ncbi:hypothetical protein CMV_014916 [Castanea mollissima]|uniref:Uncharacterized protein n=1 Tax=Castanea mollissima TaxID=60419 RepID=A0A8J4RAM0_9ROSI|nr:hypothetical protein CMV_014916 [Castanea mollissima]
MTSSVRPPETFIVVLQFLNSSWWNICLDREPYTLAWLVKKASLTSPYHRNMIRNFNWMDKSLQDTSTDPRCSKVDRGIINVGNPIFHALEKGLKSKIRRVS